MAKLIQSLGPIKKAKVKRPGVHAKTKTSRSKNADNYTKPYRGQGK